MKKCFHFLVIIAFALSCKKEDENLDIVSVSPLSGGYNTIVTIGIKNFNANSNTYVVQFNQKQALIKNITSTQLQVEVPKGATSGPITIAFNNKVLTGPDFEYVLTPTITTIAGNGNKSNKDGNALESEFDAPSAIATDSKDNVFVLSGDKIRKITKSGIVSTIDTPGIGISGICVDKDDNLYACGGEFIFKVYGNNSFSTIATANDLLDGKYVSFDEITCGPDGLIYAVDSFGNRIFSITPAGVISLVAGKTQAGYLDGDSKSALFNQPRYLAVDDQRNIFVTDFYNTCIRKISSNGIVTTVAGKLQNCGYADGNLDQALFCMAIGICLDSKGDIFVSETINPRIRVITVDGVVKTLAGTGVNGYLDGAGDVAEFYTPTAMCVARDGSNNIYIADFVNYRIRMLSYE